MINQHHARARELMTLAMGVGITNERSIGLMAAKLEEWERKDKVPLTIATDPLPGYIPFTLDLS